jgi:hypothetical protein
MPLNIDHKEFNNGGLLEYAPYELDNDSSLIIDKEWFESLTDSIKSWINTRLSGNYTLGDVHIPHAPDKDTPDKKLLQVYQSYLDGFDYHVWYNPDIPFGPKNVRLIQIPKETKKALLNKDETQLATLKGEIDECIHKGTSTSYFIRLSSTSGKNEKPVRPFTNSQDIISHLLSMKIFESREYERENKDTYLIIMPWLTHIDPRFEFRIFVVNNKLTAASPQYWFEHHQHTSDELEAFEYALKNIKFINNAPYNTFVADVHINVETKTCHLIELNPFGAHSGAGASFFNWCDDYDLLHGLHGIKEEDGVAQLRYLSAINY